jgi:HEAT repeat protein
MNTGILTTDTELVIRSWDDWLAEVTGIPADAARGQPLAALAPGLFERGLLARFQRVLADGAVEILAPAFHRYLIRCAPRRPSRFFDAMQQYVTIAPLRAGDQILGTIVSVVDVTEQREREHELAEQLESADEQVRLRAAQHLAEDADAPADALIGAIGDASWRVRRAAVGGLAHKAGPETIAALVRALHEQHQNPSVLNSALQVLAVADEDALAPLVECLGAPDPDLRGYVALALGERGDPAAAPALLHALDDADINVRYHAIEALGKLRTAEAVDALAAVAETRDF